ncbi:MAG: hypothetical protein OHK0032_15610 [Thermodesulfovibrionales bacterium]
MMEDKRQFKRTSFTETIGYSVSVLEFRELKRLNLKAEAVDISEGGLGIITDYPLEPGHVLRFTGEIEQKAGIVSWAMKIGDNSRYRVGIKFI